MPYNFEEPRYYQSNVEPGSLGIRIAGLVMQGANQQKSLAMDRERLDIAKDRLKQQALEDVVNQQELAAISEITSTFPTTDDPLEQNKWLSQNAGKLMRYKNGPQVLSGIDRMVDNNLQLQAKYGLTELAADKVKERAEILRLYGEESPATRRDYYLNQRSYPLIQKTFKEAGLPIGTPIPPEVITDTGNVNMVALHNYIVQRQAEVPQQTTSALQNAAALEQAQASYDAALAEGEPTAIAMTKRRLDAIRAWTPHDPEVVQQRFAQRQEAIDLSKERFEQSSASERQRLSQSAEKLGMDKLKMQAGFLQEGVKVVPGPGGLSTVELGPKPLSTSNVTDLQSKIVEGEKGLQMLDRSIGVLAQNPDAAGLRGIIKEKIEGLAPLVGVKTGTRVTDARTELRNTATQIVTALRVDEGAMSDKEQTMLREVGDPLDWDLESEPAQQKLSTLRRLITLRTMADRATLKQPQNLSLLNVLTDQDLADAFVVGYITREQAQAEYARRGRK